MARVARLLLSLGALELVACNALLGLGDDPHAEPTSSSSGSSTSVQSGGGGSTSITSSSVGTSSSDGGGGAGTGASSSVGGGGEGAGGAGPGGGPPDDPPCGKCSGGECGPGGVCVDDACVVRVVPLDGGDGTVVVQGIAVSPSTITVGVKAPTPNLVFTVITREDWARLDSPPLNVPAGGVLERGADRIAYYATNASDGRVLPVDEDGFGGPVLIPGRPLRGVKWEDGPTAVGSLLAVDSLTGQLLRYDLTLPDEVCPLSATQGDPAIGLSRGVGGAGWVWSLEGALAPPVWLSDPGDACDAAGGGVAATTFTQLQAISAGSRAVAYQGLDGLWLVTTNLARGARRPTNDRWGLLADGETVIVPKPLTGLERCDDTLTDCNDPSAVVELGSVQGTAHIEGGLLVTDLVTTPEPLARLVCIDASQLEP